MESPAQSGIISHSSAKLKCCSSGLVSFTGRLGSKFQLLGILELENHSKRVHCETVSRFASNVSLDKNTKDRIARAFDLRTF